LCAFVEAKINPSSDLFKLLSKLAGKTEVIVKEQYNVLHKNNTGTDDDPFTSPLPFIG